MPMKCCCGGTFSGGKLCSKQIMSLENIFNSRFDTLDLMSHLVPKKPSGVIRLRMIRAIFDSRESRCESSVPLRPEESENHSFFLSFLLRYLPPILRQDISASGLAPASG